MHKFDFHPEFSRDYPRIKRARYYPSGGELFRIQKMNSSGLLWTPSKRQKGKLFSADEEAFHGCEESKLKIGWSVCRQAERRFSQVHREKGSLSLLSHSFSLYSPRSSLLGRWARWGRSVEKRRRDFTGSWFHKQIGKNFFSLK